MTNPIIPTPKTPTSLHTFSQEEMHQFGTSTTEAAEAIPSEVFSDLLLEALYAQDNLRGAVAASTVDLTARAGDTVSVIAMPRRSASTVTEGSAVSDSADDPTETTIQLTKWGTRNDVTRETFEDSILTQNMFVANNMAALGEQVTSRIATKLVDATPGQSVNLATAGTLDDFYEKVVDLKQAMKGATNPVDPDMLLVHPDMTGQILKDARDGVIGQSIRTQNGNVMSVAGLEVVENNQFNALNNTSGDEMAVIIDSSRAVGEAWGRRPETIIDETTSADSDEVRTISWMRYETEVIDTNAVGHVQNP